MFKKIGFELKNRKYNLKFKLWICLPFIAFLVIVDNLTKMIAVNKLTYGKTQDFLPNFINFELINNKGSAYGANSNHFVFTVILACIITVVAILAFLFFYNPVYAFCFAFIIGGSLGNLLNRTWNSGYVTDFLTWQWFGMFGQEPAFVFNVADFFVCLGIASLITSFLVIDFILDAINKRRVDNGNYSKH